MFELVRTNKTFVLSRSKQLPKELSGQSIRLYLKKDNIVWVATTDSGLIRYNMDTKQITRYRHDPADTREPGGRQGQYHSF